MDLIKFVVMCLICKSLCFAVENQTTNLEQQSNVQKREKHYLLEDDPCEGPEQKREERQSIPGKTNVSEPKIQAKPLKVRLQPKILPTGIKPALKSAVLPKRVDTTPQRVPTKIPVVLKNAKVLPTPAQALRLKMLESRLNDTISNKEVNLNASSESNLSFRNGTSTNEEKNLKTESRSNEGEVNSNSKIESLNKVTQIVKDSQPNSNEEEKKIKIKEFITKPEINLKTENPDSISKVSSKPNHFFLDEPDPLPPGRRKQSKTDNQVDKNKDVSATKTKEFPITKVKDNVDQTDNDRDIVQISNGTHLITIKKIGNKERHKMHHILTHDEFDEPRYGVEERIMNNQPVTSDETKQNPPYGDAEGNIILAGVAIKDSRNKDQNGMKITFSEDIKDDPDDSITIINHDYEEFEEITFPLPVVPVISTNDVPNQGAWNYYQPLQSFYYNPYQNNIYDQYKKYIQMVQNDPNSYTQTFSQSTPNSYSQLFGQSNYEPVVQNTELSPTYFPNINENYDEYNIDQKADVDLYGSTYCPDYRTDSTLDRIWRAWKDVEIKIRKAPITDDPIIDIRRTMGDYDSANTGEVISKLPIPYASQPIGLNGYYNNQNSAVMYPYMNPTYRYMR